MTDEVRLMSKSPQKSYKTLAWVASKLVITTFYILKEKPGISNYFPCSLSTSDHVVTWLVHMVAVQTSQTFSWYIQER